MKRVLLAGSTGYLGGYILKELLRRDYSVRAIVRNPDKLDKSIVQSEKLEVVTAQITQPEAIVGCCENMDVVISTVGITRQKDKLTYEAVDYQANANILEEARKSGVKKFIYISVFKGDELRKLKIMDAKERFVDTLKASGMDYAIIRPTGFFSDMRDFLNMAKNGKVYLFGDGQYRINPIHGFDLAEVCAEAISSKEKEINVGGPDVLTQNDIGTLALKAWNKKGKIVHIAHWVRKLTIWIFRTFTPIRIYGPIEFFLTAMAIDVEAPKYGKHHLETFFMEEVSNTP